MTDDRPIQTDHARAVTPDRTDAVPTSGAHAGQAVGRDDRGTLLQREKAEFGGMRFFLAFFGWLTATGAVVLLTAVVTGILAALGVQDSATKAATSGSALQSAGVVGIIVLAVVLFIGFAIGGYVAGRMARFSGLKQGLAVWLWALIIAILAAVAGFIAGSSTGAFSQLNTAGLPISGSFATAAGIVALLVAVVFSLAGALLGGVAGMRFHRKVDRFGANA